MYLFDFRLKTKEMKRFKKYESAIYKDLSKLNEKIDKIEENLEKFNNKDVLAPYQKYFNSYSKIVSIH